MYPTGCEGLIAVNLASFQGSCKDIRHILVTDIRVAGVEAMENAQQEAACIHARRRFLSTLIAAGGFAAVSRTLGRAFDLSSLADGATGLSESGARELV